MMNDFLDNLIRELFESRWHGDETLKDLASMKAELRKTLQNQQDCYWSGHTAYHIAVDGGFLFDGKSNTPKRLTPLGQYFMDQENTQ